MTPMRRMASTGTGSPRSTVVVREKRRSCAAVSAPLVADCVTEVPRASVCIEIKLKVI
jgi:hypothetical protein